MATCTSAPPTPPSRLRTSPWAKQPLEVERARRGLKTTLDLRPIYHRKKKRSAATSSSAGSASVCPQLRSRRPERAVWRTRGFRKN
jgi:hypothetical protein